MKVQKVLVVCVGNICRSPVGERILQAALPGVAVTSAGIGALVGHSADDTATKVAAFNGVSLDGHISRQLTAEIGADQDLILVMETGHKHEIARRFPQLSGRTMLFDQWTGMKGIADPYRLSQTFHEQVFQQIKTAAEAWAPRLKR
jgi:protein-tyrosine phosphatase